MSDLVKHAFGLLWMDEPVKARKLLADALSIAERGDGIDIARKSKQKPRPLPPEIIKAVEALHHAAKQYQWLNDDEGDHGWVKYSAAAVVLEHWAGQQVEVNDE